MSRHTPLLKTYGRYIAALLIAAAALLHPASAQTALPLKHGTYVSVGTVCKDAPLAATQMVNRSGIQYPHLWGCKAHITEHQGANYRLDQTCQGGEHDKIFVTILSREKYSVGEPNSAQEFRFCSSSLH